MGKKQDSNQLQQNCPKKWSTLNKKSDAYEMNKLRQEIKLQFENQLPRKDL